MQITIRAFAVLFAAAALIVNASPVPGRLQQRGLSRTAGVCEKCPDPSIRAREARPVQPGQSACLQNRAV